MALDHAAQNKQTVQRLFDVFNAADLGPLDALVADGYTGPQGDKGPGSFRTMLGGLRTAFPDLRYTVDDLVAEGSEVAVRWHLTGTHQGPFRGHAPTGKAVTNEGLGIFRLAEGKIIASTIQTDRLGFLQQIGLLPENVGVPPGPVPAKR